MALDRRQQKTRAAIFDALERLLQKKHFNHITVQEIIDEANVGRSTFYAHFETKDDLLRALCSDIFDHIISEELTQEHSHDFSKGKHDIGELLEHILCHLKDDKDEIRQILSSESEDLFLGYFRESLKSLFKMKLEGSSAMKKDVPESFQIDFLTFGFSEAVRWWVRNRMEYSPEDVTKFYLKMVR
ncbi:MAG: TetR/AcrR family transcriptional regulator [Lachnospiraceae bacterium]|nr:TetR/AcrR family transcriptional regulator [Lachnospiraceae bacterium]